MADETIAYLMQNDLDADVFFTGADGPIAPELREDWIADHEEAVSHPDIEYDNETGFYNFSFRVPEEAEAHYRENREEIEQKYANRSQMSVTYSQAGIFIVGSVQNPGTACMMSGMVEDAPALHASK